ncbi:MAG: hypothetical protein JWR38_871 [Mucilaginibacter sp.]|nr:hypothetical protein [Mucilaginibacter sp.]
MLSRFVAGRSKKLILLLLLLRTTAFAQHELNFTTLTAKDGLSSNTVNAILKDRYGLMWFGTADGLNKFDGTNVTVYRHDARDTTSLPANEVLALYEDASGRIWIATTGGGITFYDKQRNSFVKYLGDGSWNTITNSTVKAFCEDHLGNLWVATYEGLRKLHLKTNKISTLYFNYPGHDQPDHVVISLFEDSHHRMWVGTSKGLYLYNWKTNKFTHFVHQDANPQSLSGNVIKTICEDKRGNLWFGTFSGLNQLLPDEKSFRAFKHIEGDPQSLSHNMVYIIAPYGHDKLWLGTEDGLNILDLNTSKTTAIKPNQRNTFSLTNKSVRSIFIDKEGIAWLGTFRGGVNKYDKNLALFNLVKSNAFDKNGLTAPIVTAFAEYTHERIFVGTDGGGLHLFDRRSGLFTHFDIRPSNKQSSGLSILAIELDKKGQLWIGTYGDGLFCLDPVTGKYRQFLAGNTSFDIDQNDIFCIKEDSKGNIWIGTNGNGINVYDPHNQTFTKFSRHPPNAADPVLPLNGFMRTITEDANGNIWLGSSGTGIAVYHPKTRTFSLYNKSNSNLADDGIVSVLHDRQRHTWVGTNGGGISLFNERTHQFTSYSEKDGLANGFVYKILEDKNGMIWLSTDKGISCFNPQTHQFKNFSRHNGLQDSPFVMGSGLFASEGELFFGGQDGFNYFDPNGLPANRNIPAVILTDLKVANTTITPADDAPIRTHISIAKEIHLAYGQNFSISYVALNYTTPHQNQYSYKLDGFDKEWNFVGTATTAYYTNLSPGNYVFHVRASNNEGSWNEKGTTIIVKVFPPLYRTVYAYALYALVIVGLLFYLRHRGIQKIKKKFALEQDRHLFDQERREVERLHELDLLKIKFLTNLSHEFRTPISLILAPADTLLSMQKDTATSGQVHMIKRNAKRLLNLVNQLLDFRKMEEHELKLSLSSGDLVAFVKEAADSFQDLSERKKIQLSIISSVACVPACFDHDKIERIVFNLLSNAFKFTHQGGLITLELSVKENIAQAITTFCMQITDTGIGISHEQQGKIFERFFQNNSPDSILNQGSGIGLSITKEFVQLHGGEISVKSTLGQGTAFIVSLPVISDFMLQVEQPTVIYEQVTAEFIEPAGMNYSVTMPDNMATVLLVEDNDDLRFYLKDNLKAYYHIIEATNGKDGWQKALSCHPQLIVSDISMPYMNGIELSRKIKADKRTTHIPVILLTAITGEQDQIIGLESGANDYLTKPFNFEILNAKIKNLLLLNRTLKDTYSRQIQVMGQEVKIESSDARLLNSIVQYIEEKLNDPELSVEELSRHVGMSRGSLYHKLLELTGLSPIEYIRSVKLDKAATLLEKSDLNVAQIAYMTGFGTPSYFSKMFKAKFKVQPSEYLNSKRKDAKFRLESIADNPS